jgi:1-acyl-sn-glycerol-3-phosphate acyltransferase
MYNIICELLCLLEFILDDEYDYDNIKYYYAHCYLLILDLLGVNIYINGNISKDRILWISNHRSKLDGLVIQSVICSSGSNTISVVKKLIAYIPIFTSFGKYTNCIFIQRTKSLAEKVLMHHSHTSYIKNRSIMIFPEGATMTPHAKQLSDKYAQENNLSIRKNVLLPRIAGFDIIKSTGKFNRLGDITIRYAFPVISNNDKHSFIDLLWIFPKKIYIDVSYHDINTINLYTLFEEKDKHLENNIDYKKYKLFDGCSDLYKIGNLLIFIAFFSLYYLFPIFFPLTIGITICGTIRSYFIKYDC